MSTQAIDRCLSELQETYDRLASVLQAFQTGRQQIVKDETKAWLQGPISSHQARMAEIESLMAGLRSLAATDYPELTLPEMPAEVGADVEELHAHLTKSTENLRETMNLLRRQAAKKPTPAKVEAVPYHPPVEKPAEKTEEKIVDETVEVSTHEPRRGRQ